MNAAGVPPRGAAGATASCSSGDSTRIATCAINDDGAEKKKKAVLNCGAVIRPPADTRTNHYSQNELIDLTLAYTKQDIHQAIHNSDYGPGKRKINDLLPKNTFTTWPLSPAQEARVRAMIEPSPSMLRSDSGESATSLSANSSTSTNLSCTKDTNTTNQFAPIKQTTSSKSDTNNMVITRPNTLATVRPRTVTPENVPPPTTSNSSTATSSSSGQKRRPDTSTHTSSDATVSPNNIQDKHSSSNKRTKVSEKASEAAKVLCPKFIAGMSKDGSSIEWKTSDKSIGSSTITADANILEHLLKVISKGDSGRASAVLNRMLGRTSNAPLTNAVVVPTIKTKDADVKNYVLGSIHACMRHFTPNAAGGTRTIAAETLIKNIALGCVFNVPDACTPAALARVIGTTADQIRHARERAGKIRSGSTIYIPSLA